MFISKLFIEFMVYSFLGWIYECTYCTVKEGHWANRGFLFGPICPIYGTGAVVCSLIFGYLPMFRDMHYREVPMWQIFVICAVGSFFLEYGTSYLLEKRFHAVWWDYADMPLNINGRVCVPATVGFGVAGILCTKFVFPVSESIKAAINPMIAEVVALLLMAYLAADLVLTVSSLVQLLAIVEGAMNEFDVRMEKTVQTAAEAPGKAIGTITAVPGLAKGAILAAPGKAREAIISYEEAIKEKVTTSAARLNFRQEYELKNIKNFRFRTPTFKFKVSPEKMIDFYKRLQDNVKSKK